MWTFGRFRRLFQTTSSSLRRTASTRPVTPFLLRMSTAALVLGASMPQSRTMMRSEVARSDRADFRARRIIFLGVRWA
jgi:hypothetical protein